MAAALNADEPAIISSLSVSAIFGYTAVGLPAFWMMGRFLFAFKDGRP